MGRRRSPYLMRTKADKTKERYEPFSETGQTSQDIFYTTESNETHADYGYSNKLKDYQDFYTSDAYDTSRLFETYGVKRKGSGESYTYDDYSTSGVSYDELSKRSKRLKPYESQTDQKYSYRKSPGRYNNLSSSRGYSIPDGSRVKKRSGLSKNPEKLTYEDILEESEQYLNRDRRHSFLRSRYYKDLIHEEPEKEYGYEKYFEQTPQRAQGSPKHKRQKQDGNERYENQNNKIPVLNKAKDYHVYAYQEPKHHEGVFKAKNRPNPVEDSAIFSEVEIKTHDYPVLAFREGSGKQGSDIVYLPVIVLDKNTGKPSIETNPKETPYQANNEQFQVFAANLQDQQNIFQNFGDHPNIVTPKEKDKTQNSLGIEIPSGMRYANSLLGSMINEALINPEIKSKHSKESKNIPFTLGKSPLTYQVDVDISSKQNKGSLNEKSHSINSTANNPLHDGYPVTKDYIKVISEHQRKRTSSHRSRDDNTLGKDQTHTIKAEPQNPSGFNIIDDERIALSIAESKINHANKSIIKVPSDENHKVEQNSMRKSVVTGIKRASSVAAGTKQGPRPSSASVRSFDKTELKEPTGAPSKLSVVHEETPQDLIRKSSTTSKLHDLSVDRGSKVISPVLVRNASGTEIKHSAHEINRKSTKPETKRESNVGRRSIVQTSVARPPSSSGIRQSDLYKEPSQVGRSDLAKTGPSPVKQSLPRVSPSQTRLSVVSQKPTETVLLREDSKKSKQLSSAPEPSNKEIPTSQGRKSIVNQSVAHQSVKDVSRNTLQEPHRESKDDSAKSLRQFTKEVFELDLEGVQPHQKTPNVKSEIKKSLVPTIKPNASVPVSSICPSCQKAEQKINNQKGMDNVPIVQSKKTNLMRTSSKVFSVLSKLGKRKTTDQEQSGKDEDHTEFVHRNEPTVTQYKNEQKKTPLMKSNSKSNMPKEKKSITKLFSRSKSKLKDGSGDDGKKGTKGKKKSGGMLGILRRSKSNTSMDRGEDRHDKAGECECFTQYVQNTRLCAYYFLGTTLHEQIMHIIQILLDDKEENKQIN